MLGPPRSHRRRCKLLRALHRCGDRSGPWRTIMPCARGAELEDCDRALDDPERRDRADTVRYGPLPNCRNTDGRQPHEPSKTEHGGDEQQLPELDADVEE